MKRKVTIGIVLFISGIILLFFSFGHHVADYLQTHQSRAENNAKMIDENIAEAFDDYEVTLDYLLNHEVFSGIHDNWIASGDSNGVQKYLTDHLLLQSYCMVNVVIRQDEKILLTVNEPEAYDFKKIDEKENYYLCEDAKKKIYLGIADRAKDDTEYVIIVDLEKLFDYTADEKQQVRDGVVFISKDGSFVIYKEHGRMVVDKTDQVIKEAPKTGSISALKDAHQEKQAGIITYTHYNPREKEERKGHLLVVPVSEAKNGFFTLGIVINFGDTIRSIQNATVLAVGSGFLVAGGLALLLSAIMNVVNENKKRKQEVEKLFKKNAEMEKVNLELQEQAHRQRLETIGVLTAGVAHEFNNLLTPIMGYSMMSLEQLPDDNSELYDNLLEIYQSSCKAKEVISRLSQMTKKKDTIVYEEINIDQIIDKTLGLLKASQPKKVSVEKNLKCKEACISGNETLLMQMIMNLVLNSFQMMEETGGVVDITTRKEEGNVLISVGDNGPGIMECNLGKIFEPFFTTKYAIKGIGLGLSIVHQVVEAHRGTITVKNREEGGCVFDICLPVEK